ncbi:aldehyde dehydrogenase [Rhodococcus sp. LB1]|uniref:aldehyde dehydrogenase n=1 Tax=Rhodococcus sp. LB1 TaxID=1807499 RepID=UPI00077A5EAA|nr:aldehyde dehydrogenase [Rhodococcus sp. LB1]KXX58918.1 aldehyde dehydrogenase [Rhodococcus sp. LB1]
MDDIRSFDKLFIGGQWVAPAGNGFIEVISPVTEQAIARVPDGTAADAERAIRAARRAFDHGEWPRLAPAERASYLRRIGDEVKKRRAELEETFVAEVGAPLATATAFHGRAMDMWDDNASLPERAILEDPRQWPGGHGLLVKEPVGVVAVVIPWNAPICSASSKMGQALAAGCPVILKPAPESPVSTMVLAEAIEAAGLPEGVVSIIPGGRELGEYIVSHKLVDAVTFTGSTAAGKRVMSLCSQNITRVALELGGKSAGIIADDVPLDRVLPDLAFAGIGHSGQVCAALTRVLVPRKRHDEVTEALAETFRSVVVGNPRDAGTHLGPLIAERQRDRVEDYIGVGQNEGAKLVTGGGRPQHLSTGWFVEPTLFAQVDNSMRIAREEIFGPVVGVIPFDSVEEAIDLANDSDFGLSGAVYASENDLAESIARRIRTGQVSVNSWDMCTSEPFGGFKQSGIGREGSVEGMDTFLEKKLIQFKN